MNIRMYTLACLTTVVLIGSPGNNIAQRRTSQPEKQLQSAGLFDKFQILNIPRGDISVGWEWTNGLGPTKKVLEPSDLIETSSLSHYDLNVSNNFNAELRVRLFSIFGLSGGYAKESDYDLKIENASLVRVGDIDKFNFSTGRTFIWEGIKVKSISLIASKSQADTISVRVKKISKQIDIMPSQSGDKSPRLYLSGLDLFVAYRLVSFGNVKSQNLSDIVFNIEEPSVLANAGKSYKSYIVNSIELGSAYTGTFYPDYEYIRDNYPSTTDYYEEQQDKSIWINLNNELESRTIFTLKFNGEMIGRTPKILKFKIPDTGRASLNLLLSSTIKDNELVTEELTIEKIAIHKSGYPSYYETFSPYVTHHVNKIPILNVNGSAPGW